MKMKITAKMIRLIFTIFCTATLACNSAYAETTKSAKKTKLTDTNQTISDDEWLKEMQILDNQIKEEKNKQDVVKAKTIEAKKKTGELKKLNKTLDEALDLVNTKK